MAKLNFKIEGMKELEKKFKELGKVPQKHVTSSAKKGMGIVLKAAKKDAPKETGKLKKGMVLKGEKAKEKGKKVFRIVWDRTMNDIFQKKNKNGKVTGYYPASMEYGFFDKKGVYHDHSAETGWIAGFIHSSLQDNTHKVEQTIVDTMKKKIDNELRKVGLKNG